jgi:peptide-N4-(N-acetyl-beta-glucosaminyl)asparagine amidase
MGFEVRHISAMYEDHVWVELFSEKQNRWIHYDPCENKFDQPLMYELGWGKKLSYVIATSIDLIVDVSGKYSISHDTILASQCMKEIQPNDLKTVMKNLNISLKNSLGLRQERIEVLKKRRQEELAEIKKTGLLTKEQVGKDFTGRLNAEASWLLNRGENTENGLQNQNSSNSKSSSTKSGDVIKIKKSFQYICSKDETICDGKMLGSILKKSNVNNNIFRKVEDDWNMAYLCRKEGSETGSFRLKFESQNPFRGLKFENIVSKTYETGAVRIMVASDKECFLVGSKNEGNVGGKVYNFKNSCKKFSIWFVCFDKKFDGGNDVQWQHAQFFRQELGDKLPGFSIKLV